MTDIFANLLASTRSRKEDVAPKILTIPLGTTFGGNTLPRVFGGLKAVNPSQAPPRQVTSKCNQLRQFLTQVNDKYVRQAIITEK